MSYISFEKYGPEYQKLWDTMKVIRDDAELQRLSRLLTTHKDVYKKVEDETGVPWEWIAVAHVREAGETDIGVFKRCLHNGERIIGTGRKTRLVPEGRGPFNTWHEAAVDALKIKGFDKIKPWPVSRMLWALEPYNGYGYRNKGLRSPYLWASTNHQQRGKYIADHVFDANVMDKQIGAAALLRYLGVDNRTKMPPIAAPVIIATTTATVAANNPDYMIPIVIGAIVLSIAAYFIIRYFKNRNKHVGNN